MKPYLLETIFSIFRLSIIFSVKHGYRMVNHEIDDFSSFLLSKSVLHFPYSNKTFYSQTFQCPCSMTCTACHWKFSKMARYDMTGIGVNLRDVPDGNGGSKLKVLGLLLDGPAHSAGVRQVCRIRSVYYKSICNFCADVLFPPIGQVVDEMLNLSEL